MTSTSKKILFFGNEKLATGASTKAPVLSGLINSGFEIAAIIVAQQHAIEELEVAKVAKQHDIEVLSFSSLRDPATLEAIGNYQVEAAVLASYGKIIPESVLQLFSKGIINAHPSLLPKHRGPIPIESAILADDTQTGVSLIRLVKEMDAGPVYDQQAIELDGTETKQQLVNDLGQLGSQMLARNLDDILTGQLTPKTQDEQAATYDKLITKADGLVDWQSDYQTINRMFRAYFGWPGLRTTLGGIEITILSASFLDESGETGKVTDKAGQLGVYCSDGLVILDQVLPASKKPMSGKDFLLGYHQRLF